MKTKVWSPWLSGTRWPGASAIRQVLASVGAKPISTHDAIGASITWPDRGSRTFRSPVGSPPGRLICRLRGTLTARAWPAVRAALEAALGALAVGTTVEIIVRSSCGGVTRKEGATAVLIRLQRSYLAEQSGLIFPNTQIKEIAVASNDVRALFCANAHPSTRARRRRAWREALSLRQEELADLAGCSARFVHELETAEPTVQLDKLLAVLTLLGLHLQIADGTAPAVAASDALTDELVLGDPEG